MQAAFILKIWPKSAMIWDLKNFRIWSLNTLGMHPSHYFLQLKWSNNSLIQFLYQLNHHIYNKKAMPCHHFLYLFKITGPTKAKNTLDKIRTFYEDKPTRMTWWLVLKCSICFYLHLRLFSITRKWESAGWEETKIYIYLILLNFCAT